MNNHFKQNKQYVELDDRLAHAEDTAGLMEFQSDGQHLLSAFKKMYQFVNASCQQCNHCSNYTSFCHIHHKFVQGAEAADCDHYEK